MAGLLDHLDTPEPRCACGHHEGSHSSGFAGNLCLWCDCGLFVDDRQSAVARVPR
ncbi:MAG: hypothetical protein ACE5GB_13575 [Acidimicrobiales bacterium]